VHKVYQLFAHGRWFSPGTTASSTTKSGRHDIAEILLKVALNTKNQSIFTIHRNLDIASGGEKARLQRCTYILTPPFFPLLCNFDFA
jgi:hypothetical protein